MLTENKYSWDEWVPQDRALKWSEENLNMQKELREEHIPKKKGEKKKDTKSGTEEPTGPAQPMMQGNKKRAREMDMDKVYIHGAWRNTSFLGDVWSLEMFGH